MNGSRRPRRERNRSLARPMAGSATPSTSRAIILARPAVVPDMPQTAVRKNSRKKPKPAATIPSARAPDP